MSEIARNAYFINFLLQTIYKQQSDLLNSITLEQVEAITEIFHNLQILPLSEEENTILRKYTRIFKVIGQPDRNVKTRRALIKKHKRIVLQTLTAFRNKLLEVVMHMNE
jgi:hypothetical protein